MIRCASLLLTLALVGCATSPTPPVSSVPQVSSDPKWDSYGPYLSRVVGKVQKQWDRALVEMRHYPKVGAVVVVFTLDESGRVTEIVDVKNGSSKEGAQACVSAITSAAPYGAWTEEMKAILGTQQQITFTFYYQD